MSDDTRPGLAGGDSAFGGSVGDALPGREHPGRHAAPGPHDQARPTRAQTAAAYGVDDTVGAGAHAGGAHAAGGAQPAAGGPQQPAASEQQAEPAGAEHAEPAESAGSAVSGAEQLAAERLADLQRLQAEYINYKKRVDRDRDLQRELVIVTVVESLLPVLDEIQLARDHGELQGPFERIAEKLEATLSKYGVERYGAAGEPFDPAVHEAMMHSQADLGPGVSVTTVVQVMQPGYKVGDRVVRAAMVAVADPA